LLNIELHSCSTQIAFQSGQRCCVYIFSQLSVDGTLLLIMKNFIRQSWFDTLSHKMQFCIGRQKRFGLGCSPFYALPATLHWRYGGGQNANPQLQLFIGGSSG
jgi:hypothetical protein